MSPLTVFVRTLMKTTAIFIGVTAVFLNPSLDWSSASAKRLAVTAQQSPRDAAIDALIGALDDTDAGVRREAITALGHMESRKAVPALIKLLREAKEPDIKRRSAQALGLIEDARALDALTIAMKDDDASVRRAAVQAIARITGE